MSFHFHVIKAGTVLVASDMAVYGKANATKQKRNERSVASFVGNLRFGQLYADWILTQARDYSTAEFIAESETWCRRTWADKFAPFEQGETRPGLIVGVLVASRDDDGEAFVLSVDRHWDSGEFFHAVHRGPIIFVCPTWTDAERAVIEEALFPLLTSPMTDADALWSAFQNRASEIFRQLHTINENISIECEVSRV